MIGHENAGIALAAVRCSMRPPHLALRAVGMQVEQLLAGEILPLPGTPLFRLTQQHTGVRQGDAQHGHEQRHHHAELHKKYDFMKSAAD